MQEIEKNNKQIIFLFLNNLLFNRWYYIRGKGIPLLQ